MVCACGAGPPPPAAATQLSFKRRKALNMADIGTCWGQRGCSSEATSRYGSLPIHLLPAGLPKTCFRPGHAFIVLCPTHLELESLKAVPALGARSAFPFLWSEQPYCIPTVPAWITLPDPPPAWPLPYYLQAGAARPSLSSSQLACDERTTRGWRSLVRWVGCSALSAGWLATGIQQRRGSNQVTHESRYLPIHLVFVLPCRAAGRPPEQELHISALCGGRAQQRCRCAGDSCECGYGD